MGLMSRVIFAFSAALLASVPLLPPAAPAAAAAIEQDGQDRCQNQQSRRRRGGLIGGIGGRILGRAGVPSSVAGVAVPTQEILSEAVISMLDCREREQAAAATDEAIRGGSVGSSATWQSESRPNVSGSSTVTARTASADGDDCMTVTDIVIVDGQETRAPKRMCRRPPRNRYVRV
jgi:surface antigen